MLCHFGLFFYSRVIYMFFLLNINFLLKTVCSNVLYFLNIDFTVTIFVLVSVLIWMSVVLSIIVRVMMGIVMSIIVWVMMSIVMRIVMWIVVVFHKISVRILVVLGS